MLCELNRISSHLVWLATGGMELGALSMMLYGFRERETILGLFELITGLAHEPRVHPPGRRHPGSSRWGARPGARRSSTTSRASSTITRTFSRTTRSGSTGTKGIGLLDAADRARARGHGADAARLRCGARSAQVAAVLRLRALRVRRADARRERLLRPLRGAARRDAAVAANRPAGDRRAARRTRHGRAIPRSRGRRSSSSAPTGSGIRPITSARSWASRWKR